MSRNIFNFLIFILGCLRLRRFSKRYNFIPAGCHIARVPTADCGVTDFSAGFGFLAVVVEVNASYFQRR